MTIKPNHPPEPPAFDATRPLIVFDGVRALCSGCVHMLVRLDRQGRFRFTTAQSPIEMSHPLAGMIVRYRGWLDPSGSPASSEAAPTVAVAG